MVSAMSEGMVSVTGTAFAIGPNQFITNFHVLSLLLKPNASIEDIHLSQEGHQFRLRVSQISSLSALYDLVLFETKESVSEFLEIEEGENLESSQGLFSIGYPQGILGRMEQVGRLTQRDDLYYYTIPMSLPDLKLREASGGPVLSGASGGPVLNSEGRVVGVMRSSSHHFIDGVKVKYVRELITKKERLPCSQPLHPYMCFREEVEKVKEMAENGVPIAENILGAMYLSGDGVEKDFIAAVRWLRKAAERGLPTAQFNLSFMYARGEGVMESHQESLRWLRKAAEGGLPTAQWFLEKNYPAEGYEKNRLSCRHLIGRR